MLRQQQSQQIQQHQKSSQMKRKHQTHPKLIKHLQTILHNSLQQGSQHLLKIEQQQQHNITLTTHPDNPLTTIKMIQCYR